MQRTYCFFHIYTFLDNDFSTLIENRNNFQFWQDVCVKSWLFPFKNFMSWRRLCLFFFFIGTNIIIPYSFFVCKTVGWVEIGHHFESFTVATTTWLTAKAYLCHKWQRICSTDMGPFNGKTRILKLPGTTLITEYLTLTLILALTLTLILTLTPTLFVHDLVFPKYSTFHSLISMVL